MKGWQFCILLSGTIAAPWFLPPLHAVSVTALLVALFFIRMERQ